MINNPYVAGLASNLLFSFASIVFTVYAFRLSPYWVSAFKSFCSLIFFSVCLFFIPQEASIASAGWLLLSGLIGFNLSDILLLRGFTYLGPSRTLLIFSFHPLIVGVAGAILFEQPFPLKNVLALFIMACALFMFISERKNLTGRWEFKSFIIAFSGVALDACGVIFSRLAFSETHSLTSYESSFYRALGSSGGFVVMIGAGLIPFFELTKKISKADFSKLVMACFFGTFISSLLYLSALPSANLAILSSLSIAGPLVTAIGECIWHKKLPGPYLLGAFILFGLGLYIMAL